jgi:hypothetical protein
MRVPWLTVYVGALVTVRAAWAQETASAQRHATAAVAAFPDVVTQPKTHAVTDPVAALLDGDPYADALAAIRDRQSASEASLDDEDPYAEQMKLMNPYTEELRSRTRPRTAPVASELLDLETNPYTAR